ncbi:MAG: hypothetical protein J0M02_00635 [Planctomycetes bacterium]|nr:hypothetical protein [Planctomycetota bacterium]
MNKIWGRIICGVLVLAVLCGLVPYGRFLIIIERPIVGGVDFERIEMRADDVAGHLASVESVRWDDYRPASHFSRRVSWTYSKKSFLVRVLDRLRSRDHFNTIQSGFELYSTEHHNAYLLRQQGMCLLLKESSSMSLDSAVVLFVSADFAGMEAEIAKRSQK